MIITSDKLDLLHFVNYRSNASLMMLRLIATISVFSLSLLVGCEPSPPCPNDTELEGEIPPSDEAELAKVQYKSFEAACVVPGASGTLRHGFFKSWYRGGRTLKSQYTYEGGVKNGEYRLYYVDGKLRESGSYRFGIKHGKYQSFHRNGKVHIEGEYQDGKKSGDFAIYSSNGTHVQKGPYFLGMKHGKWTNDYTALSGQKISLLSFYHYGKLNLDN